MLIFIRGKQKKVKPKLLIFRAQYKSQDKLWMTRIHLGSNDSLVSYEMVNYIYHCPIIIRSRPIFLLTFWWLWSSAIPGIRWLTYNGTWTKNTDKYWGCELIIPFCRWFWHLTLYHLCVNFISPFLWWPANEELAQ